MRPAKRWLKRPAELALRAANRLIAPVVGILARRGIGPERQLERGYLAVPLHYYQPIFDPDKIPESVWRRKHDLPGIEFDEPNQLALLSELGTYGAECRWPEQATSGYYAQNGSFGYSSAALLHALLRHVAPRRVIEVGAGMSTLIIGGALERNGKGSLTTIDPNPRQQVRDLPERYAIIPEAVEHASLAVFESLEEDDVLFIDSSHVVRTGGDVTFLYLDVLPRLASGVVVHVHDIQLPYEYAKEYSTRSRAPRMFWTEQYVLQAFLSQNRSWQVALAGYWIQRDRSEKFRKAFPLWNPELHRLTTSFYIRAT